MMNRYYGEWEKNYRCGRKRESTLKSLQHRNVGLENGYCKGGIKNENY